MPQIVTTAQQVRAEVAQARAAGNHVGLVPTMGALHEGHLTLMRAARRDCDYVVVSIFVNPTQFGPGEDYARYPRDLEQDARLCSTVGVDVIFAPAVDETYPPGDATVAEVTGTLVEGLCAPFRPGHFRGVTTVCARLFSLAQPDRAYFGEKDYQQLRIVTRMVADLRFPLEIVPIPTVREPDGLAQVVRDAVAAEPRVRLQYVEARDAETLAAVDRAERPVVVALAAHVGKTRLIDNIVLGR